MLVTDSSSIPWTEGRVWKDEVEEEEEDGEDADGLGHLSLPTHHLLLMLLLRSDVQNSLAIPNHL